MKNKFSIELPSKVYKVGGVPIEKKFDSFELLFSADRRTYPEHVSALGKLGYQPASVKIFTFLAMSLFDNRNSEHKEKVEILRKELGDFVVNDYPFMATGFEYNPEGQEDKIIHNYMLPKQEITSVDLVGPDGFVTELKKERKMLEALLGTKEINKADEAYSWIFDNKKRLYLWRFNSKPETKQIRVARFIADSGRAYFGCNRGPAYSDASLGVHFVGTKNLRK